jgi:hypothetical protein
MPILFSGSSDLRTLEIEQILASEHGLNMEVESTGSLAKLDLANPLS